MNIFFLILSLLFLVFCAVKPFYIKKIPINMASAAFLVIILLLILGVIDVNSIYKGIIGHDEIIPWKVMVIFFTVAYASISTDLTGVFDVIAHKIVQYSAGKTQKLFFMFYAFAALLTLFTSNDIVILTLTPIIFYLGKRTTLNIIPFLFAEFFGANILSMMFLIGNPTNIIIAHAMGFTFFNYFKIMFFPTIVVMVLSYLLLRWFFLKDLKKDFVKTSLEPISPRNYIDIGVSAILLIIMLYTLMISDFIPFDIWQITTFFWVIFLLQDITFTLYKRKQYKTRKKFNLPFENNLLMVFKDMPWKIAPFVFALFTIISVISSTSFFSTCIEKLVSLSSSLFTAIFATGTLGILLVNIINNQPMAILFTNILTNPNYVVSPEILEASAYAAIIASNLGANLTLVGALAGLMWEKILQNKGVTISYLKFLKVGIVITPILLFVALLVLFILYN